MMSDIPKDRWTDRIFYGNLIVDAKLDFQKKQHRAIDTAFVDRVNVTRDRKVS